MGTYKNDYKKEKDEVLGSLFWSDPFYSSYTKPVVENMLKKGKKVVKWIKAQL